MAAAFVKSGGAEKKSARSKEKWRGGGMGGIEIGTTEMCKKSNN